MLNKISRIALLAITIFVTAIVYPDFYKTSFKRNLNYKSLNYSEVLNDFLIVGTSKDPIYDRAGNVYSVADYEKLIPLSSFRQLMSKGMMPDSLKGVELTFDNIVSSSYEHRIPLRDNEREYGLLPLAHGSSEEYGYKHQGDFMRIGKEGIEFVVSSTNSVDEEKSGLFDDALRNLSYSPPAKRMWGNVVPGGDKYNGVFFTDQNDNFFQVKYFDNKPVCRRIELPYEMEIVKVFNLVRQGVIAYVFNDRDEIFIVDDNRNMTKIPADGFSYKECWNIDLSGNLFYNYISFKREGFEKMIVLDKEYSYIDSYILVGEEYAHTTRGKVEAFMYPFKIEPYTYKNGFDFNFVMPGKYSFLLVNVLLASLVFCLKRRKGHVINKWHNILDIVLVCLFGVYAFTGIMIFKTKE